MEGYCFVYKMVLALIKLKEKQIRANSMEENLTFVPNTDFYEAVSDDELIETACKFEFDNEFIRKLEEEYNSKHKAELMALEKSSE